MRFNSDKFTEGGWKSTSDHFGFLKKNQALLSGTNQRPSRLVPANGERAFRFALTPQNVMRTSLSYLSLVMMLLLVIKVLQRRSNCVEPPGGAQCDRARFAHLPMIFSS